MNLSSFFAPRAPSPPVRNPWRGHLPELRGDPLRSMLHWRWQYGDLVRLRLGTMTAHVGAAPAFVERVLLEKYEHFDKQTPGFNELRSLVGDSLLTGEGSFWRRRRRIAQPSFHKDRMRSFAETITSIANDTAGRFLEARGNPKGIDSAVEMTRFTLRVACRTLLSTDVSDDADSVGSAVTRLLERQNERRFSARAIVLRALTGRAPNDGARAEVEALERVLNRTITERRASATKPTDLLTMLMDLRDEDTGEGLTDSDLRAEILSIFLAGHESTANSLIWTLYLLARHPDVRRRVEREVDEVLGGRAPTADDIPSLAFVGDVIKESMRLYPPAWMMSRRAVDEDEYLGMRIPANSLIILSPWVTHRHPDYWDHPEAFDPDRWRTRRGGIL